MAVKVEILSTAKLRTNLDRVVNSVFDAVPKDHIRGIGKVVIVDRIEEKSIPKEMREKLPYLYHPRMSNSQAWLEIALANLLPKDTFTKRLISRLNLKSNLAGALLAMVGLHYHLTLSHGIKKHQQEQVVKSYIEKYFIAWRDANGGWRAPFIKLMKPLHPYMERFGKWLSKEYLKQQKKQKQEAQTTASKAKKK